MEILRRVAGPLLLLGVGSLLVALPFGIATGELGARQAPWLLLGATFVATAAYVRHRLPDREIAQWFAVVGAGFGLIQSMDGLLAILMRTPGAERWLAMVTLGYHLASVAAVIALAHVLGLFPDGRIASDREHRVLIALRLLFVFPPLAFVSGTTITLPAYHDPPAISNPFQVVAATPVATIARVGMSLTPAVFVVGVALLIRRYRRGTPDARRRIRWLLFPALLAGFGAILDVATALGPSDAVSRLVVDGIWVGSLVALPIAIAVALLRPDLLDVDLVLRRSLVYGSLWSLIALTYVVAAATLGMVAGQRLDVGVAIVVTVLATLLFQPARQRLERVAERLVFGARTDPAHLVARLGATLAETFDLDTLLPHMETTLEQGLDLTWVRVRIEPDGDPRPSTSVARSSEAEGGAALTIDIVLGDERLGEVRCGPRRNGLPLTADDEQLVGTLARQAALAVRNVKLTAELGDRLRQVSEQATELERSRLRLVRAQESERRRIERNIHDGVQQDLVALLSHCGRIRTQFARDPSAATELLDDFQAGLERAISDLRELAHGIHPTLLTDRGLVEAIEALAARSPLPVTVRTESSLRGQRFPEEVEGAGYFTVAEALTNVAKHAGAERAEVLLHRANGSLFVEVRDDGNGFDEVSPAGDGLANLAERVRALGGSLDIESNGTGTRLRVVMDVDGSVATDG